MSITTRARLYLIAIDDWKAAFEVAKLLGDKPVRSANVIRKQLLVLVGRGLAEHGACNDTFRITDAGRAALSPTPPSPIGGEQP